MNREIFDRETILDITVNVIPLAILLFFSALFIVVNPWGFDPLYTSFQHLLTLLPFVLLAILTYYAARAIAGDELRRKQEGLPIHPGRITDEPHYEGDESPAAGPELSGEGAGAEDTPSAGGDSNADRVAEAEAVDTAGGDRATTVDSDATDPDRE